MCTHALLSGNGLENIENSTLDKVVVTDTIPLKRGSSKIEVLSISELVADVIESVVDHTSIAPHFEIGNI